MSLVWAVLVYNDIFKDISTRKKLQQLTISWYIKYIFDTFLDGLELTYGNTEMRSNHDKQNKTYM